MEVICLSNIKRKIKDNAEISGVWIYIQWQRVDCGVGVKISVKLSVVYDHVVSLKTTAGSRALCEAK